MPAMFNAFSGIRYHQMHKYITVKYDNKICKEDLLHRKKGMRMKRSNIDRQYFICN